ncbi:MAG: TIGR03620 family F420-dependent LLM class oxidoreductase [Candidatus Dormibacter sp.]
MSRPTTIDDLDRGYDRRELKQDAMTTTTVVEATRRAPGPIGVLLPVSVNSTAPVDVQREAVHRLENAGYRAAWTNEVVGGKDALVQLAVLLAATQRMVFGTSIANIWARPPQTAHAAAALLSQAFPGRFVLGLGVGYPQQAASVGRDFGRPVATMRDYLDQMASLTMPPAPDAAYPKIVGATGPKMLAMSGETTDGAIPIMVPPEYTAHARQVLGPDKLLVVGLAVVTDADPAQARTTARQRAAGPLSQPGTYPAAMTRLGYSEQDISDVSDRLVDAIIGHGDAASIEAKVREHLAAGADHVIVMTSGTNFGDGVDQLAELAATLVV